MNNNERGIDDDDFPFLLEEEEEEELNDENNANFPNNGTFIDKATGKKKLDYYRVLKLLDGGKKRHEVTQEDITQSFRKLSRETHPDRAVHMAKQNGMIRTEKEAELLRNHCEIKQQLLNEAYEVLSNPMKRAQYDILGPNSNLALVPMSQFKNEAEYREYLKGEKLYKEKRRREMLTNGTTQTTVHVNAQNMFNRESPISIYNFSKDRFQRIFHEPLFRIAGSSIMNSFTTPIGDRDVIRLSGYAEMERKESKNVASHSLTAEWTRVINPGKEQTAISLACSFNTKLGDHFFITSSTLKTKLDEYSSMGITWNNILVPHSALINVFHIMGFHSYYKRHQLFNDKTLNAKFTWSMTANKYMALQITKDLSQSVLSTEIRTGDTSSLSLGFKKKLSSEKESKALILDTSLTGSILNYESADVELDTMLVKNLSKRNNVGLGVSMGLNSGINLKLSYTRERHQFNLPVQLCDHFDYRVALLAVAVPMVTFGAFRRFVYLPLQKRWKRQALYTQLKNDYERTKEEREKAQEQREHMLQGAMESKLREEQVNGLIIINAQYGLLLDEDPQLIEQVEKYPPFIDVTDQLQFFVKDSALRLPEYSKSKLEGFYDCCPSSDEKYLVVTYNFRGKKHRVKVHDEEELIIPLEEHLIEEKESNNGSDEQSNNADNGDNI